MSNIDTVRIQGRAHSWGDTETRFDGDLLNKYTAVSYDEKLERALLYGAGKDRKPVGKSKGKYVPGKIKFSGYVGSAAEFELWMAKKAPDGRSISLSNINVATIQFTSGTDIPIVITFYNVGFCSATESHKEGPDGLACDIELDFEYATKTVNGEVITIWDSSNEVL